MNCWRCERNSAHSDLCIKCTEDNNSLILLAQEIEVCSACPLGEWTTNKVIGRGFWAAPILFIGEAPGKKEDELGIPFVGAAGIVLDTLIDYAELPEKSYYITNIVRCRPAGNRAPLPDEVTACLPFLKRTIEYIKPKVIVTLGAVSTRTIFDLYKVDSTEKIMRNLHGGLKYSDNLKILPVYHPAAILYDGTLMDKAKDDFKLLKILYEGI